MGIGAIWALVSGVSRFANKETIIAIAIAVAASIGVVGMGVGLHNLKVTWTAARDGEWQSRIAEANKEADRRHERTVKASEEAAQFEREAAKRNLDDEVERAAALERTIATMKDDPVAFPRDIARELRR